MQNTKFTIILTSPLVITADGDFSKETFAGDFCRSIESKKIGLERKMISTQDNEKIKELEGDLLAVAFTFTVPISFLSSLCKDIADEIFQHESFSPQLRILVEGAKDSSVISLSGINAQGFAEKIQEILTKV